MKHKRTPKRKRMEQEEEDIVAISNLKKIRVQESVVSTSTNPDTRKTDTATPQKLQPDRRTPSTHKQEKLKLKQNQGAKNLISYFEDLSKKPTHKIQVISEKKVNLTKQSANSKFNPTLPQLKNKLSQSNPPKRRRPRKEQGVVKITNFFTQLKEKVKEEGTEKVLNSQSSDCNLSS